MNFKIVEGVDELAEIEGEFIHIYNDTDMSVDEIRKHFNLTISQYYNYRMRLIRRGLIKSKPQGRKGKAKNYCYSNWHGDYIVYYQNKYYTRFHDEESAKMFVELMRLNGWDRSKRDEIREKVLLKAVKRGR